jgi:hypothetical protein
MVGGESPTFATSGEGHAWWHGAEPDVIGYMSMPNDEACTHASMLDLSALIVR